MKFCFALFLFFTFSAAAQKKAKIFRDDFKVLTGQQWTGTLTYLDYSSGKKNNIPANVTVLRQKKNVWNFVYEYPKEPHENGTDTVTITDKGRTINNEKVVSRQSISGDTIEIITEKRSTDDGVEKIFRYTYRISNKKYSVKKEEKRPGDKSFIERNTYAYQRG